MRGIQDGPDFYTDPLRPTPKRVALVVALLLAMVAGIGALAGVTDGPDGVDPLGDRPLSVELQRDGTVTARLIAPITTDLSAWPSCTPAQRIECDRRCQAAAPKGYLSLASTCEYVVVPRPDGTPGVLLIWQCRCTWSPVR